MRDGQHTSGDVDRRAPASRSQMVFTQMTTGGVSFWTAVYQPFMARDLTRDDLRAVVEQGLARTQGSYDALVPLFNMSPGDCKRFLNFLNKHGCHIPFQTCRTGPAGPARSLLPDRAGNTVENRPH
jgi:hypothetical protein